MDGLTGTIQFDQYGKRVNFSVNIMELKNSGPVKVQCLSDNAFRAFLIGLISTFESSRRI